MNQPDPSSFIPTINGGSSIIKFAPFRGMDTLVPVTSGMVDRLGLPNRRDRYYRRGYATTEP